MPTEPSVHLLRAAVLQQGLNQDVQVFFWRLSSELLLARQTGFERQDDEAAAANGREGVKERDTEWAEIMTRDKTGRRWRRQRQTKKRRKKKCGISKSPRDGAANPPRVSPAALIQMLEYQICNKCEMLEENEIRVHFGLTPGCAEDKDLWSFAWT